MMISVIIPVYNAAETLARALNSVANQVTDATFEIIIINDGSTDGTVKIVENFIAENPRLNIQFLQQENRGVSAARNTGLRISQGDFIALLDADDEWLPNKTAVQMKFLTDAKLNLDFLASSRNGKRLLFPYHCNLGEIAVNSFRKQLFRNETQPSTVIFKRKILINTGFFNEDQRYAEDVNYWLRISQKNKMGILNESLVIAGGGKKSFGVSGLSSNLLEMRKGYFRNFEEMYRQNRIGKFEVLLYKFFYRLKYYLLLIRK